MFVQGYIFVAFAAGLVGLIGLFLLKSREVARGAVYLPRVKGYLDRGTLYVKSLADRLGAQAANLPALCKYGMRRVGFLAALTIAAVARSLENRAHDMARIIAHPYRAVQGDKNGGSKFLRAVLEHKRLNGRAQAGGE